MTKNEAVKELSALITRVPDFAVPLDMAITALHTDGDCISRQVAIDIVWKWFKKVGINGDICLDGLRQLPSVQPEPSTEIQEILDYLDTTLHPIVSPDNWYVYSELHDMVSRLSSVQPEKLTDKEQRIFLSAMGREEDVCKEVDDAWRDCREPYEDSLVHVCEEIRRKVKGALWT